MLEKASTKQTVLKSVQTQLRGGSIEPACRNCTRLARRRGSTNAFIVGSITLVSLFGVGLTLLFLRGGKTLTDEPLTAVVERGTFVAEVLDQGEIQSSDNVEFRCEVKSAYSSKGISVLKVIEEGKMVKGGDVLIELDSAELKSQLDAQNIALANAIDAVAAAENALKAANVTREEYEKGIFVAAKGEIDNAILLAKEEKRKAEDYYKHSQRLAAKRYITDDQLQADKFAVERAENALMLAQTQKVVLEQVTYNKMTIGLDGEIDTATSKLNAVKENLKVEQKKQAELIEQIDKCTMKVPDGIAGQVTYANVFSRRGNSEWVLEPGATVREQQVMIRLPDREKMQVRAAVNESRITSIKQDMPVIIHVDALGTQTLEGIVSKVSQYAEPDGWGSGGVKKYAVYIQVNNPSAEIRPGMNASVSIQIEKQENVLMAPLQCIYGAGKKTFCLLKQGDGWETREITVNSNNDKHVWIESGVKAGDVLAMNPGGFRDLLDLPQDVLKEIEAAQKEKAEKGDSEDKDEFRDEQPKSQQQQNGESGEKADKSSEAQNKLKVGEKSPS